MQKATLNTVFFWFLISFSYRTQATIHLSKQVSNFLCISSIYCLCKHYIQLNQFVCRLVSILTFIYVFERQGYRDKEGNRVRKIEIGLPSNGSFLWMAAMDRAELGWSPISQYSLLHLKIKFYTGLIKSPEAEDWTCGSYAETPRNTPNISLLHLKIKFHTLHPWVFLTVKD